MTKQEALTLAKEHTGKSDIIYVTSDSNVFFKEHKWAAEFNAKEKNLELFSFTTDDLKEEIKTTTKKTK